MELFVTTSLLLLVTAGFASVLVAGFVLNRKDSELPLVDVATDDLESVTDKLFLQAWSVSNEIEREVEFDHRAITQLALHSNEFLEDVNGTIAWIEKGGTSVTSTSLVELRATVEIVRREVVSVVEQFRTLDQALSTRGAGGTAAVDVSEVLREIAETLDRTVGYLGRPAHARGSLRSVA